MIYHWYLLSYPSLSPVDSLGHYCEGIHKYVFQNALSCILAMGPDRPPPSIPFPLLKYFLWVISSILCLHLLMVDMSISVFSTDYTYPVLMSWPELIDSNILLCYDKCSDPRYRKWFCIVISGCPLYLANLYKILTSIDGNCGDYCFIFP